MHRHGYKGRKFGRERDQRRALLKGLADSLIIHESIETTLPKAKELRPYVEKLITKAKKGDLHNRRLILTKLNTVEATHKLVDGIAPKLSARNSGYLRITKTTSRKGDNSLQARISFVDNLSGEKITPKATSQKVNPKNQDKKEVSKPLNSKTTKKGKK